MTDSTASAPVVTERSGGVTTVRLNRPDAMNSLDIATKEALLATLQDVATDESVRCVVLTGTGRAFCVGQDLKEHVGLLAEGSDALFTTVPEHYNPIVTLLSTMDKPVVAAVNGVAAGAGAAFAFAADVRILADSAGFNLAFTGIALSSDSGSSFWLPRLVGVAKAKELLLMPRTVPADEALELGLATQVVPADEFAGAVDELAIRLAAGPTKAYGAIRRAVEFSATHTLAESLAHEAELMTTTGRTEDHRAAVDAFLAKEKPTFEGR
ncbi:enoyl-CoA hydratase [Flexivirga endophytica]|uniref:Enoyl-CoA hydratase n=1 Tax=Flexivirga endophytica TaxID=1849103 RepID=A0A916TH54_9MICO|nr:enoyl-CoA hydratase-related protein [Flexivirga endophytica]GGB45289.1 enoyl-CoA hydratase [Flexivirga endophytica]GHB66706.1 enoyl-CoA hydratase [Flexivirga endophytica]